MKIERRETKREGFVQITSYDERWYLREKDNKLFKSNTWVCGYCPKGVEFYKWLASMGWDEAQSVKEQAGEKGSRVHKAIEVLLSGGTVSMPDQFPDNEKGEYKELTTEEYGILMTFADWWAEFKTEEIEVEVEGKKKPEKKIVPVDVEILGLEMTHFNEALEYACTLDIHLKRKGVKWIIDVKTGQSIYNEHLAQLSGIYHCDDLIIDLHKLATIQVGYKKNKRGWKFTEVEDKWNLWLAAHEFWKEENADKHPYQFELPTTITL